MSRHTLPADVARCTGVGSDVEGWREGCDDCLRRLAPSVDPERVLRMTPPAIVAKLSELGIPSWVVGMVSTAARDFTGFEQGAKGADGGAVRLVGSYGSH